MDRKQKNLLLRVEAALALYVPGLIAEHFAFFERWPQAIQFFAFLLPYLIVGWDIIRKAGRNMKNRQMFDENLLMVIATWAAFGIGAYSEACAVMLFYQIGELFQSYAVGKSRASIAEMMSIAPEYANLETDGGVREVEPDEIEPGSVIRVRPGEKIPLDGVVLEGSSFVDSSALTGESVPRRVSPGEQVISGCVNGDAALRVRTTKRYEDSTVARILELVENASEKKARLERFITRFARWYTPCVTFAALLLALVPPLALGAAPADWIRRACIFLIVSCPCALVISIPLGFFGGIGAASRIGVLVKGANYLEALAEMDTLVFDKTGTLTKGEFRVSEVLPAPESGMDAAELLELTASAEQYSTHPVAGAIRSAAPGGEGGKGGALRRAGEVRELSGLGLCAETEKGKLWVGNAGLMLRQNIACPPYSGGGTVVYVAEETRYLGSIVISDRLKDGARAALAELKSLGIRKLVMLSGDRAEAANAVAVEAGVDEVYSELLPADKVSCVEKLLTEAREGKKTGFVGDGINDAPVLMRADVGIAMGSLGSDAAIEAADVVLMDDDIRKIAALIEISKKTLKIVKQNIIFSLAVKAAVLVLGALGLASMWQAVFGDVGVTVLAILNSMRVMRASRGGRRTETAPPPDIVPLQR